MDPVEFNGYLKAKIDDRRNQWRFRDRLNCRLCEIILSAAGAEDIDPNDFRVLVEDEQTTEEENKVKAKQFEEFMRQKTLSYRPGG